VGLQNKEERLIPGDTRFVKAVSGLKEDDENITPYIFQTPVSPHLASRIENNPIDKNIIREKFENLNKDICLPKKLSKTYFY
jgi:dethiobiotin synthetase